MKRPALILDKLRPDQSGIARDRHKVRAVCCGRRWGKTCLGSVLCLSAANAGFPVCWLAPQIRNTRPLWKAAKKAVRELKVAGLVRVSEADRTIEFLHSGGLLEVHSGENADGILGNAYALVVCDEAGLLSEDTINEVVYPTLSDYDGELVLIGSPKGLSNLFYVLWQRGQDGSDPDIKSWRYPSSANPSPTIQRAIARAKNIMPDAKFRQEFEAEFISDGNSIFTNIDKLATATEQLQGIPEHEYIGGLDFGKVVDYSAFVTFDVTINAIVNVLRINEIDYRRQREYFKDVYKRFKHTAIIAEKNSIGQPLIEELVNDGLPIQPFTTSVGSKNELVDLMALKLQNEAITFIPDKHLIGELRAYTGKTLKSGLMQYGSPAGLHDDVCMGAMLAVYGAETTASWEPFVID